MFVPDEIYKEWAKYKPIANAGVTLLDQDNRVLLLERSFGSNKGLWEFPSGAIEKAETPMQTAMRELQEETNIKLHTTPQEIGTFRAVSIEKTDIVTSFLGKVTTPIPIKLSWEHSAFKWIDLQQSLKLPMHSMIKEVLHTIIRLNHRKSQ